MAQDFILLATLGRTDVQVVLPIDGVDHRMSVAPGSTRSFQDACVSGRLCWTMVPLDDDRDIPENKDLVLDYDAATGRLESRLASHCDATAAHDGAAPVTLCAPLLSQTVRHIKDLQKAKSLGRPVGAVLLNTRREPPIPTEPAGAARLVAKSLAEALGLDCSLVQECVFLSEGDLYESDASGDRHLRSDAARRMDKAIREALRQGLERTKSVQAVITDVGGFPETKAVLAEAARYRFGNVRFLRPVERRGAGAPLLLAEHRIPPAESLQTRRQASALIRAGAWDAAARLAKYCVTEKQAASEPWRGWLDAVATALRGHTPDLDNVAGATRAPLERILAHGPLLLIAVRIEAALRRGAWVEALRELFTWFDAAVISLGNRFLSRNSAEPCIDLGTNLLKFHLACPQLQAALREEVGEKRTIYADDGVQRLLRRNLPDRPRLALRVFDDAITPVRGCRNAATHGWLSHNEVNKVRQLLEQSGVWRKERPCFLGCSHAESLFELAEVSEPAQLYNDLVEAVLRDMDDYSFGEP